MEEQLVRGWEGCTFVAEQLSDQLHVRSSCLQPGKCRRIPAEAVPELASQLVFSLNLLGNFP